MVEQITHIGTKVLELTSTSGTKLFFTNRGEIKAGVPYYFKPERVSSNHTYTLKDIEVASWDVSGKTPELIVDQTKVTGFYTPTTIPSRAYVFADDNKLFHLTASVEADGFRCYFQDMSGYDRQLTRGFDDNTTGIDGTFVAPQAPKVGNIYTVNGQLVRRNSTAAGLAPGVYIMNGIKLIVK